MNKKTHNRNNRVCMCHQQMICILQCSVCATYKTYPTPYCAQSLYGFYRNVLHHCWTLYARITDHKRWRQCARFSYIYKNAKRVCAYVSACKFDSTQRRRNAADNHQAMTPPKWVAFFSKWVWPKWCTSCHPTRAHSGKVSSCPFLMLTGSDSWQTRQKPKSTSRLDRANHKKASQWHDEHIQHSKTEVLRKMQKHKHIHIHTNTFHSHTCFIFLAKPIYDDGMRLGCVVLVGANYSKQHRPAASKSLLYKYCFERALFFVVFEEVCVCTLGSDMEYAICGTDMHSEFSIRLKYIYIYSNLDKQICSSFEWRIWIVDAFYYYIYVSNTWLGCSSI